MIAYDFGHFMGGKPGIDRFAEAFDGIATLGQEPFDQALFGIAFGPRLALLGHFQLINR